ncbi:CHAP domain-containing protein [Longispora albida]|uniref:CHAP domain-containing protein n=1 Tax=Longispora albida TaxID=203523 RepID=UPI0003A407E6|nr:CHAP domain-containing protein [Longispora albida]
MSALTMKRAGALLAGVTAIVALTAGQANAAPTLGEKIAAKAKTQVGVKETGNNCNPYGPCQAWCADFVRWVWKKSGAKTSGTNSLAASFKSYGQANGTYRGRTGTPKVGDAVMFDWNNDGKIDHVSIVVKVGSTTIDTVGGNESGAVRHKTGSTAIKRSNPDIVGYTTAKAA